ncbi:hypothetical protein U9R90_05075 [Streptomyces sp. E11-3]|uniref:hypothetical protein n=1 Tax=Streptomyces sp. E11-3 TaxID=3110112 RepID=UPI00397F1F08
MPNEPTLGELARRLEAVHLDLKEDIRQQGVRLDGKVSQDVFELRMAAFDKDLQAVTARTLALEQADRERVRQRAADRRWIVTALVVPVLLVFLQAYLTAQGAGT